MTHQEQLIAKVFDNSVNALGLMAKKISESIEKEPSRQQLLDDFAKAAMQGHIASEYYVLNGDRENYEALAKEFYAFADALMQERERRMKG